MSTVEGSEKSPKKKKSLLGDMHDRLGLGEGSEFISPRLRNRAEDLGPIGMPFAANIGLEQRKAQEINGNMQNNPAITATAKMTGRTKEQVISNLRRY